MSPPQRPIEPVAEVHRARCRDHHFLNHATINATEPAPALLHHLIRQSFSPSCCYHRIRCCRANSCLDPIAATWICHCHCPSPHRITQLLLAPPEAARSPLGVATRLCRRCPRKRYIRHKMEWVGRRSRKKEIGGESESVV